MWINKGLILKIDDYKNELINSHASIPFALHIEGDKYRIYFSSRNKSGKCLPYYIDSEINNGEIKLINQISAPILDFGKPGTFDDSGIMPSSLVKSDDKIYMYYIGWNEEVSVSYKLSIGLAISYDGGNNFKKFSDGPILDRSMIEPYFNTAPFVIKEREKWKMWFVSCTEWVQHNNKMEPVYNVKYCESLDGINWIKNNITCIDYNEEIECIGRPCVIKKNIGYEMFFSNRKSKDYRNNKLNSYKISKSLSMDGIIWDNNYEMDIIPYKEKWDKDMREYCHVFTHKNITYMLYNGNDFGKEGFGYSIKK